MIVRLFYNEISSCEVEDVLLYRILVDKGVIAILNLDKRTSRRESSYTLVP